jgi:hypothetical protein
MALMEKTAKRRGHSERSEIGATEVRASEVGNRSNGASEVRDQRSEPRRSEVRDIEIRASEIGATEPQAKIDGIAQSAKRKKQERQEKPER